ncbi:MAG: ParB/RepB/Spo0J family partition protein [Hydrococcus sp. Prado102]|jgi:ParB family chromosome partitioning protein|nr:ParB/RepB/Spo0J family partition protein [Hydrococcus sp. Prado102]
MSRRTLSKQPYQLKGVDALFGEASISQVAAQKLSLAQISLPSQQPRRYFDPQAMEQLIASVKQYGVLQPLIVRPQGEGKYELVAGERRYRAALAAKLPSVPVVVRELSDEESWQLALLENLQREDLNPVEETEGILQLLSWKLGKEPEAAIALLNQAAHPERESVDNVIHTSEWQVVLDVFEAVGKFTPESFRTNRLPLLKLPDEIKEALKSGRLAYTKARAIAKLKDFDQRRILLEAAISEDLSLSQIQERIENLKLKEVEKSESYTLKSRVNVALRRIKKSNAWDDPKKKRRLEKVLAELESLV